jgi:hypothetical protein
MFGGGPDQCEASKRVQNEWRFAGPDQCEASKRVQGLWTFGGPNQCEESKRVQAESCALWMFGSPNQCDESKRAQARGVRFSLDERLWDNNLKRAQRYAATGGPIPMSMPTHMKGRVLSKDEEFEKVNITWIKKQRIGCSQGYYDKSNNILMGEQRKIKFQASGLLDQCAEAKKENSSSYKKDEVLWDNNLKRAVRYAATSGPIPRSMPTHMKGRVLSEDEE